MPTRCALRQGEREVEFVGMTETCAFTVSGVEPPSE
jgi:hypothetical protein